MIHDFLSFYIVVQ